MITLAVLGAAAIVLGAPFVSTVVMLAVAIGTRCALQNAITQPRCHTGRSRRMPKLFRRKTCRARVQRAHPTPAERALWSLLRGRALEAKFRRQHPLGPYIADFFCCDAALVIEVDGDVHDTDRAREHDAARDAFLANCGLRTLRLRNEMVLQEPARAVAIIRAAILDDDAPLPPGEGMG